MFQDPQLYLRRKILNVKCYDYIKIVLKPRLVSIEREFVILPRDVDDGNVDVED